MQSIFQIFKMVFGVVASVMLLYFMITYAGAYSESQKDSIRYQIAKNFRQTVDAVYATGNAADFDFSRMDKDVAYDAKVSPPVLRHGNGMTEVFSPLFFRYGKSVSVTKNVLDLGWWKIAVAEAAPEMTVVFNPVDGGDETWSVLSGITDALPDTVSVGAKFRYAFCGSAGPDDVSQPVERFEFQRLLSLQSESPFAECSAAMPEGSVMVRLSRACSAAYAGGGICVNPDGNFCISGSGKEYNYMDGFDIAAAIIGGTEGDELRGVGGENLYLYKQKLFSDSLKLAAGITAQRAQLMSDRLSGLEQSGRIEEGSGAVECISLYSGLKDALRRDVMPELADDNYYKDSRGLSSALAAARVAWEGLVQRGCEV